MGYWQYLPIYCLTRGRRLLHSAHAPIASGLPQARFSQRFSRLTRAHMSISSISSPGARPHEHFEHFLAGRAFDDQRQSMQEEIRDVIIWSFMGLIIDSPHMVIYGADNVYGPSGIVWG